MILEQKEAKSFEDFSTESFITTKQLAKLLDTRDKFKEELLDIFEVEDGKTEIVKVGNAKFLLNSLLNVDAQCEKIDITAKVKDIKLSKMLDAEKALFEIFGISNVFILEKNKSDLLVAETRYSSKSDLLDYYSFSKFANYCRDKEFEDLIDSVKDYLNFKNSDNIEERSLRLVFKHDDKKFYLRAVTSEDYRDFGVNFSVFVALMALARYVEESKNEIFIDSYVLDESNVYVSFNFGREVKVNDKISLAFSLILENDEIKRKAVSFNGVFKLKFEENQKSSEIFLKPKGVTKKDGNYPVELLTYYHRGNVSNVFNKIQELPELIDFFINQVSEDATRISRIENPDDVRRHISHKVKNAKKPEFQIYKDSIFKKLTSITVDNTFRLFELLREVEELFEHDDVISRDFWRTKLYEALIERK